MNSPINTLHKEKQINPPEIVYTTINGEARTTFIFPQLFTAHIPVYIFVFFQHT
jgi:hypothetical protein